MLRVLALVYLVVLIIYKTHCVVNAKQKISEADNTLKAIETLPMSLFDNFMAIMLFMNLTLKLGLALYTTACSLLISLDMHHFVLIASIAFVAWEICFFFESQKKRKNKEYRSSEELERNWPKEKWEYYISSFLAIGYYLMAFFIVGSANF